MIALNQLYRQSPGYISYSFVLAGALSYCFQFKAFGISLSLGGIAYFLGYRWYLSRRFFKYYEGKLGADLADIRAYYRLQPTEQGGEHRNSCRERISQSSIAELAAEDQALGPSGPSCFWIAETLCPGNPIDNRLIGSIALGTHCPLYTGIMLQLPPLDFYKQPSPATAELRRLFVIPSYRKLGIGRILVQTLIAHAQANNLESVVLDTWASQRHVIRLYETFGWVVVREWNSKAFGWLTVPLVDMRLSFY